MSNPIKREHDKLSNTKDIVEREKIVQCFQNSGFLDRNDAINEIISSQNTDSELTLATTIRRAECGSVNLYQADDSTIIANLQFQIDFLQAKLATLQVDRAYNEN